jgi:predicted metal-binding protein
MTPEDISTRAIDLGADDAIIFSIDQIVFDPRTLLKCMYGCEDWGKGHTCPSRPGSLKPWEYERILKRYKWGCIVHSTSKKISQDISFMLEKEAFLAGHYFAFSMSDCAICRECAGFKGKPCVDPTRARPAFHSVGIDVFATVKIFGLPLNTLKSEGEVQNWYSAVFVA